MGRNETAITSLFARPEEETSFPDLLGGSEDKETGFPDLLGGSEDQETAFSDPREGPEDKETGILDLTKREAWPLRIDEAA